MAIAQPFTYEILMAELRDRIRYHEKRLAETTKALETLRANPSIFPVIKRLVRPNDLEDETL